MGITNEIGGDDIVRSVGHDTLREKIRCSSLCRRAGRTYLERTISGFLDSLLDSIVAGGLLCPYDEIDNGNIRDGYTEGHAAGRVR
jgi:hypothetical protein